MYNKYKEKQQYITVGTVRMFIEPIANEILITILRCQNVQHTISAGSCLLLTYFVSAWDKSVHKRTGKQADIGGVSGTHSTAASGFSGSVVFIL